MRVQLAGVSRHYGAHVVLSEATLTIGPRSRLGVVGPKRGRQVDAYAPGHPNHHPRSILIAMGARVGSDFVPTS